MPKILVAMKQVADYPNSMNPYDAVGLEAALCLREANVSDEVVAVSIGGQESKAMLQNALAMGADRAILVLCEEAVILQPLIVAKILQAIAHQELPGLVILGRQAVGGDYGQTGPMLAALLGLPQATFASKLVFNKDTGHLEVTREMDHSTQVLALALPAVITVELCLAAPRPISILSIVKAQKKRIQVILLQNLGLDLQSKQVIQQLTPLTTIRAGIRVNTVKELLDKLHDAKVLS